MLPTPQAFADESYFGTDQAGHYIFAAVFFARSKCELASEAMLGLRTRNHPGKLHWHDMTDRQRLHAARTLASIDGEHVVAVGAPVPQETQERGRAKCLERLVVELHGLGVAELCVESRSRRLNDRDVDVVRGAKYKLHKGARFTIAHSPGSKEPLLWAADILAGAMRARFAGSAAPWEALEHRTMECAVDVRR
ncbi:hypothetical protein [Actinokineospora diospyrosa]|uniref:DUF3800 domain-containing protein n=1 Tax=Actinokineospora diospyrosa TaxID=103728 RepID=A0ABT1IHI9_9PSEU|nr:hypothetical protein [Actinokineospora diospyrosa]MCP2272109.1 hypothetical protein [Actinokineospora diospyrosa]